MQAKKRPDDQAICEGEDGTGHADEDAQRKCKESNLRVVGKEKSGKGAKMVNGLAGRRIDDGEEIGL